MARENFIRFDWAAKRLLRQKSNFVVLEGFLSTLLNENVKIERMLNTVNLKVYEDRFEPDIILAKNNQGELLIIEIKNNWELDYFHRILYGVSESLSKYINFNDVKKLYSINIIYFDLLRGTDYVYHGGTTLYGTHNGEILNLITNGQKQLIYTYIDDSFIEHYILRIDGYNKQIITPLDEWMFFLKTGDIPDDAKAKGLPEAREHLLYDRLSKKEQHAYNAHMEAMRYQRSVIQTGLIEGRIEGRLEGLKEGRLEGKEEGRLEGREEGKLEGREEGREEGKKEQALLIARNALKMGMNKNEVIKLTGLNITDLADL